MGRRSYLFVKSASYYENLPRRWLPKYCPFHKLKTISIANHPTSIVIKMIACRLDSEVLPNLIFNFQSSFFNYQNHQSFPLFLSSGRCCFMSLALVFCSSCFMMRSIFSASWRVKLLGLPA